MQLVIRTAHGSADIDLESYDDDSTIGDLLTAVTGLAVPSVVHVDQRPCRIDVTVADAIASVGLGIGSTIDVGGERHLDGSTDRDADAPVVRLRQLTGRGAGETVDLPLGRYRFGAGRRLAGDELSKSTVEEEAFSVSVSARPRFESPDHPSVSAGEPTEIVEVSVRPGANVSGELGSFTPTLGGQLFDRELAWYDERLSVGGRVFDLAAPDEQRTDPGTTIGAARIGDPNTAGARSFDAAGTLAVLANDESAPELPVIAAQTRVADPTRTLWRRSPTDQRLAPAIGLDGDHRGETVTIDLDRHSGVAIAGTAEFTAGLTRTLLVELSTTLGPGELDLYVVTSAGRLGRWDWAKWLPHLRGGDLGSPPRFLTTDDEISSWLERSSAISDRDAAPDDPRSEHRFAPPHFETSGPASPFLAPPGSAVVAAQTTPAGFRDLPPPAGRPHPRPSDDAPRRRTLLVVDDAAHWTRRDSPIRELLLDPPRFMIVVATVERVGDAPGACTAVIDEIRPELVVDDDGSAAATRLFGSLCRYVERLGGSPIETTDVRPSLTQTHTAARIARAMSSYDDLRLRHDIDEAAGSVSHPRPSVSELLAVEPAPAPSGRNGETPAVDGPVGSMIVPVGTRLDRHVDTGHMGDLSADDLHTVDLASAGITVFAVDAPDSAPLLGAVTLSVAARHQPSELAILLVADREPDWVSPLPHLIGTVDADDTEQVGRVIRRVATTLAADADFQLLVIVDGSVSPHQPDRLNDAALAFSELAGSLERVHLVLSSPTADAETIRGQLGNRCGAFAVARPDGSATLARRDDDLATSSALIMPTVDLLLPAARSAPPPAPTAGLRVVPFVHGRPLTPIERRLARATDRSDPSASGIATDQGAGPDVALNERTDGSGSSAGTRASRLLPPPFPDRVGQETLLPTLAERSNGTLALGIVDRADDPGIDVYRWAPESGSLLAVGHRRSGVQVLPDLVVAAIADLDAEVWVLDPLPQRRRAFRRLPQCRRTAHPDSTTAVLSFLSEFEDRAANPIEHATPSPEALADAVRGGPQPLVLVIADMNRTLAPFDTEGTAAVLERLRVLTDPSSDSASGSFEAPTARVSIVAAASRGSIIAPLADAAGDILVGDLDDAERRNFGVPERAVVAQPGSGAAITGRCWSVTRQRLVQLATPPDPLEAFVKARVIERSIEPSPADDDSPVDEDESP